MVRDAMRPGATVAQLDGVVGAVLDGLGAYHVHGIGHGLGLRFEETPASTIIPPHRNVPLRADMTMTIGHTVLAIPGFGGVRHEDAYRVTPEGAATLHPYPIDPCAIAACRVAARSGAAIRRCDIDLFLAAAAGELNARANRCRGDRGLCRDVLDGQPPDVEVILAGDCWYRAGLAARAPCRGCNARALAGIAGPGRRPRGAATLPADELVELASYDVHTTTELEKTSSPGRAGFSPLPPAGDDLKRQRRA